MNNKIVEIIEILKELQKEGEELFEKYEGSSYEKYLEEVIRWEQYTEEVISSKISIEEATIFKRKRIAEPILTVIDLNSYVTPENRDYFEIQSKLEYISALIKNIEKHSEHWEEKIVKSESQKKKVENLKNDLNTLFDSLEIHSRIKKSSEGLFKDGYYAESIENACKEIEVFVKEKSQIENKFGKDLFSHVFKEDNPILALNELKNLSEKNEQEGFKFIFMGVSVGIRNPKVHANVYQNDAYKTLEYLSLASLFSKKNRSIKKSKVI